jgi:hypothetical protein
MAALWGVVAHATRPREARLLEAHGSKFGTDEDQLAGMPGMLRGVRERDHAAKGRTMRAGSLALDGGCTEIFRRRNQTVIMAKTPGSIL